MSESYLGEALEISKDISDTNLESLALHSLGLLYLDMGRPEQAASQLEASLRLAEQNENLEAQIQALLGRAQSYLARDNMSAAAEDARRALELAVSGERKQAQVDALLLLASAQEKVDPQAAVESLRRVMALQQELSDTARDRQLRDLTAQAELESARRQADYERTLRAQAEETVRVQLAELERGRLYDHLTGLPNRLFLHAHLAQVLELASQGGPTFAVANIDLDRFQVVNDRYGHELGDELLRTLAQRVQGALGPGDLLARVGGDEFTVVMVDVLSDGSSSGRTAMAEARLQRVLNAIRQPSVLGGEDVRISGSVGVACWPSHGQDSESLRRAAELAMQEAKRQGDSWVMYDPERHAQAGLEGALSRALSREEFELYYQPIVEVGTGRIISAETLLRWNSPLHGSQKPASFIPLLERSGMIVEVGDWVLQESCRAAAAWGGVRVAVNLSARQFATGNLARSVWSALESSGLKPHLLELEITESLMMHSPEQAKRTLRSLQASGVRVMLDDFGIGYSSLGYLAHFPLNGLKIDRGFVQSVGQGQEAGRRDSAIIRAMLQLGEDLDLDIVAEGVESERQLEGLYQLGVRAMQGYYFGPPEPDWVPGRLPPMRY